MTIDTSHSESHGTAHSPEGTVHTDGGTHAGASDFTYVKIAIALMVLTAPRSPSVTWTSARRRSPCCW